ncbi:MAG TPA: hypothetical protein VMX33_09400 [bacterium]|nr:hypothetical protein [bacterium]
MRTLYIQLPRQDTSGEGARDNVPLMAARLIAFAEARGVLRRDENLLLDQNTADHGGDAAVVAAALAAKPELVVFTLFDWNLDRSIWLARRMRAIMPATHFVAGGPEVVHGQSIHRAQAFDALMEGEWELPFLDLLHDLAARSLKPRYKPNTLLDLESLPDPYLAGILKPSRDKPVLLEIGRGALMAPLFRNVAPGGPRYFLRDAAPRLLRLASDAGADEARFIGPRIDERPDWKAHIKALAVANETGVGIRARLDPASIDDDTAKLLADAAFMGISADLGSVNGKALEKVGMILNKDGFERGSKLLWTQGIVVKPDVYLGLPYDTYETTVDTFDFLGMVGMGQDAELKPMPLAPGSEMRAKSGAFGIKEFLERPPYWVVETDWMDEDDFLDSVADFEESFDVAWGAPVAPNFKPERGGYIAFADMRMPAALDTLLVSPERIASSITLLLDADDTESINRVVRAAKDMRKENQYTLWQFVLYSDAGIPKESMVAPLVDAFAMPEHYFELSRLYSLDPQPEFQVRLFFATTSEALALVSLRDRQDLETVFVLGDSMPGAKLTEALPFLAFDRESASFELLYDVMSAWRAYPELLVEAARPLFRRSV